jgi:putative membrane protein
MADSRDKEKLAEERTDLAEDRTILANERTFAGWIRTGMAAIGIGVGFHALFNTLQPAWVPKAIATAILAIGVLIFVSAERRARAVMNRLQPHEVKTFKAVNLQLITGLLVAAAVALAAALWLLGPE